MLGHARARTYSAIELFLLQTLAGELSWVVRDLAARNIGQQKLAAASHDIKNALQVIVGNTELLRQTLKDHFSSERDRYLEGIEVAVQQITERVRILPDFSSTGRVAARPVGDTFAEIASMVTQSIASCGAAKERGIDVEVVYAPEVPGHETVIPEKVKLLLGALVDNAAMATRNETVRVSVRRDNDDLEVVLKGVSSNRVADGLKSVFEVASRSEDARDESGAAIARMREYLDNAGGDVYLKSRPGDSAEFVVRLPIDNRAHAGRSN
jgi:two-component system sensor histidine kinase EvgS